MVMQVANVRKVLGSVGKFTDAGNKVVFDNDGSYIMNKKTGEKTALRKVNGVYEFDIFLPGKQEEVNSVNQDNQQSRNRWSVFSRQDTGVW